MVRAGGRGLNNHAWLTGDHSRMYNCRLTARVLRARRQVAQRARKGVGQLGEIHSGKEDRHGSRGLSEKRG